MTSLVYGTPPAALTRVPSDAVQVSPLTPGATAIEAIADASVDAAVLLAPPGKRERVYALAQALRASRPDAPLTALAPKTQGGARLRAELEAFGCTVQEDARHHHRICHVARPPAVMELERAIREGAPRYDPALGMWTQPGVFSWDRLDPGSRLLLERLPLLAGRGADFGAGLGVLATSVLAQPTVTELTLVDVDRRAVEAAGRNVTDPRARILWADVRRLPEPLEGLDFVVMNPPFHDAGSEDRELGAGFITAAAQALRRGGLCLVVANRHLPYEAPLRSAFAHVERIAEAENYKLYEARA